MQQHQRRNTVSTLVLLCVLCVVVLPPTPRARAGDGEALLALKSTIDPLNSLQWGGSDYYCKWEGIKECMNGRVTKLVVEHFNLSGILESRILNELDELRVLSFKDNNIRGQIPNLYQLNNLKSLFLNNNNFSGQFPTSLTLLHRLKVIDLSGNQISGPIPDSLLNLPRLYLVYLQDNLFTGEIPPFNQTTLTYFNLSNNQLSGEIPPSLLRRFNASSFSGNIQLCGLLLLQIDQNPCVNNKGFPPPPPPTTTTTTTQHSRKQHHHLLIILGTVVGGVVLLSICMFFFFLCKRYRKRVECSSTTSGHDQTRSKFVGNIPDGGGDHVGVVERSGREEENDSDREAGVKQQGEGGPGVFSWEAGGEGLGRLVFLGGDRDSNSSSNTNRYYSLEELLKASAETLGRGSMGSTYKAVLESGFIVTVKRLKDSRYPPLDEFRTHLELHISTLINHPNLVPLRAYFQAKDERLLVYDYFPNGSLFSLIHGSRGGGSGGGKPLHWTSCLKIAEDLATGLLYIHQNPAGLTHGNLKSSNVLLGSDFESCLTDYGLSSFRNPDSHELESSASSLFYRAPECRDIRKAPTQQADVYSFGVVLLELLTGKTPFQDLVQEHGSNIPVWVRSVREEETEFGGDDPIASSNDGSEEKLTALLSIAMACVSLAPENRPTIREVLRMIREARAEAQVSSNNSSDHSPGRWSDTVQSLPREEHLSI